jgi:ubiquinol-cytochrome c reductase cytochrome b subunit
VYFISPVVLAHWIMGDGNAHGNGLRLAVYSFTFPEAYLLAEALKTSFGIIATIQNQTYPSRVKPVLYIYTQSRPLLVSLIRPYMHSSMTYKLGSHW